MTTQAPPKVDKDVTCWRCSKLLGRILTRPWLIECVRCHAKNQRIE